MIVSAIPPDVLQALVLMASSAPAGPLVEVGVYRGGSAFELGRIAFKRNLSLHLFDTFCGMPFADDEDKHRPGDFSDTSLEAVMKLVPNAQCYPGIFPGTLPDDLTGLGFVHCDVDQYRSTTDVIMKLWPRLLPGGIMWFDDCELEPAFRAMHEQLPQTALHLAPQGRVYAVKP